MNPRHRLTIIFAMLSLTVLVLFFQNCSPSSGGLFSDGSYGNGVVTDPPYVFASRSAYCNSMATSFLVSEEVYICIQNAGTAPQHCIAKATDCANYTPVSIANGWQGSTGVWVKKYLAGEQGVYIIKAVHTNDMSSIGQFSFQVN